MNPQSASSLPFRHGDLRVADTNRHLVHANGTPFFYLGDTAWELFHRLTLEDADVYLDNRRQKGFSVIQAVALAEMDGLHTPNAYGHVPLRNDDPAQPNEAYFEHVDAVVRLAADKGLYIGLLPTWGDKLDRQAWGTGPEIFNEANAGTYARWIAERYHNEPNIIWIVGGDRAGGISDRDASDGRVVDPAISRAWEAMGRTIREVDRRHLITFHPWDKNSSSYWFQASDWLDFNMFQSGHLMRNKPNYAMIEADYAKMPTKPCLDGEPCYEDHPINFDPTNGWFDEGHVRQAAWWAMLAGACGQTYGCHPIWQFYEAGRTPVSHVRHTWREALDLPGAAQMGIVRRFFEERDWLSLVPEQSLLLGDCIPNGIRAARGRDYVLVYAPQGELVTVRLGATPGAAIAACWFNPRTGKATPIGTFTNAGSQAFVPIADGMDWLLVLDDNR